MLKEMIAHIQETAQPEIVTVNGSSFIVTQDGKVKELIPETPYPEMLHLHSLDALVKMVETEALYAAEGPVYIMVPDHLTVTCFTQPDYQGRCFRQVFYQADATDVPGWESKVTLSFEEMQIALRTRFQATEDTEYVMKLLSEISTGAKITYNDNGVATTIVTKKGIDLQANSVIRPIVTLRPYRTFQEVEQPESTFLIRINERGISFTEADGGMWKLKARETVKEFLTERLKNQKDVVISL